MHASGFGTLFNQFSQEMTSSAYSTGVSIAVPATTENRYDMAAVLVGTINWVDVANGGTPAPFAANNVNNLTSAPDIAIQIALNSTHFNLVGFDNSAAPLVFLDYTIGASGSSWWPPQNVAPPTGKTYSYSPTICTQTDIPNNNFTRHIAVVAGGKLWYAASGTWWPTVFSSWEQASTVDMASSPDCVVTSDGTVHIVALTAAGTIADVHGKAGSFTTTDLGGY